MFVVYTCAYNQRRLDVCHESHGFGISLKCVLVVRNLVKCGKSVCH